MYAPSYIDKQELSQDANLLNDIEEAFNNNIQIAHLLKIDEFGVHSTKLAPRNGITCPHAQRVSLASCLLYGTETSFRCFPSSQKLLYTVPTVAAQSCHDEQTDSTPGIFPTSLM